MTHILQLSILHINLINTQIETATNISAYSSPRNWLAKYSCKVNSNDSSPNSSIKSAENVVQIYRIPTPKAFQQEIDCIIELSLTDG